MTVTTTQSRINYAGDNVSVNFPIPFEFFLNTDIAAIATVNATGVGTPLVYGVDFLLSGVGLPAGGTLNKTTPLPVGTTLVIYLNPPILQQSVYQSNAPFPAATLMLDLDRQTQISQRLQDQISRALRAPDSDTLAVNVLPAAPSRANLTLVFDSLGNPTVGTPVSQTLALQQITFYGTDSGTANAYVVATAGSVVPSLTVGTLVRFTALNANTGASVVNVAGTGNQPIVGQTGIALTGGEVPTTGPTWLQWTGAAWQVVGTGASPSRVRTANEIAQAVFPTNYIGYDPGDFRRYGADPTGVADSGAAISAAIKTGHLAKGGDASCTYNVASSVVVTGSLQVDLQGATLKHNGNFVLFNTLVNPDITAQYSGAIAEGQRGFNVVSSTGMVVGDWVAFSVNVATEETYSFPPSWAQVTSVVGNAITVDRAFQCPYPNTPVADASVFVYHAGTLRPRWWFRNGIIDGTNCTYTGGVLGMALRVQGYFDVVLDTLTIQNYINAGIAQNANGDLVCVDHSVRFRGNKIYCSNFRITNQAIETVNTMDSGFTDCFVDGAGFGISVTRSDSGEILTCTAIGRSKYDFDNPQVVATTAASGTGTVATITFANLAVIPNVGQPVTIAGVTPAGYNGTYIVTAATNTTVSYANATSGAQTVAGTAALITNYSVRGIKLYGCRWGAIIGCHADDYESCIRGQGVHHIHILGNRVVNASPGYNYVGQVALSMSNQINGTTAEYSNVSGNTVESCSGIGIGLLNSSSFGRHIAANNVTFQTGAAGLYSVCANSILQGNQIADWCTQANGVPAWAQNTGYTANVSKVIDAAFGGLYICRTTGTSNVAGTGPSGTGLGIVDGTCTWDFVSYASGLFHDSGATVTGNRFYNSISSIVPCIRATLVAGYWYTFRDNCSINGNPLFVGGLDVDNAGATTIAAAGTSNTPTHNLIRAPNYYEINLMPETIPANAPRVLAVTSITATQFTITTDAVPGGAGWAIAWEAKLKMPFQA